MKLSLPRAALAPLHLQGTSIKTYAILIDGGFAKIKLGSREVPATADDFDALVGRIKQDPFLCSESLYRVYYYDAPPFSSNKNRLLNGGRHNFAQDPLTRHNKKLLNDLKTKEHFALRLGETRFHGWELDTKTLPTDQTTCEISADNLRPSIQQKGVDMRIGLDIASLSLKSQVDVLVLVTGDSDFVPPMKFARREGVQFALVTFGHKVHSSLLEHADLLLTIPNSPH